MIMRHGSLRHTVAGVCGPGPRARGGRVLRARVVGRVCEAGPSARYVAFIARVVGRRIDRRDRRGRVGVRRERRRSGCRAVGRDHCALCALIMNQKATYTRKTDHLSRSFDHKCHVRSHEKITPAVHLPAVAVSARH